MIREISTWPLYFIPALFVVLVLLLMNAALLPRGRRRMSPQRREALGCFLVGEGILALTVLVIILFGQHYFSR